MPKKITCRDHNHPHYKLADHLQNLKEGLRRIPTIRLDALFYQIVTAARKDGMLPQGWDKKPPTHRHELIEFALQREELWFKHKWKEVQGWDFDECYDPKKFSKHLAAQMNRQQNDDQPIGTPPESPEPAAASSAPGEGAQV